MSDVHMVDEMRCVSCGKVDYQPSRGTTSRLFKVLCQDCWLKAMKEQGSNEAKTHEPPSK